MCGVQHAMELLHGYVIMVIDVKVVIDDDFYYVPEYS